jgi:predicted TIM-barrel fold metal-dependent hydrolase
MTAIPFVDAHVHFWDLAQLRYPWLTAPFADDGPNGSVEAIARTYLPEDYRADLAGWDLRGAVHVDAGAEAPLALDETAWLEAQADAAGLPTAIVAFAALHEPGAAALLERHAAHGRVRGIRHIVNWHADPRRTYTPADLTADDAWWTGYGLLARFGLSFDLQCYPGQMPGLAPLLAKHDDVPVVIDHLGQPVVTDADGVAQWRAGMRALAAMPHVHVKLSGFGFIHRDWTVERVRPFVDETVALFGPQRCLVASDFPTDQLFATPARCLEALATLTAGYSDDERRDLWGRNADRVYRLGLTL